MPGPKDPKKKQAGGDEKEVKDYGYGEVTTTNNFTGEASTRIFTGPWDQHSYFDVKGRGAQG